MTKEQQIPVRFNFEARGRLVKEIHRTTGIYPTEFNLQAFFNMIETFNPDGSAHIEIPGYLTHSGNPVVVDFTKEDFVYAPAI